MRLAGVRVDRGVLCPMRDGVRLACDVYRPESGDNLPVLLMRQPYGRAIASTVTYAHPAWYARQGFIVVVQDVRGRGDSEGVFRPFVQEVEDGYDTVQWCAKLAGADGRVAMYGFSYQGYTQLAAATARPPALCAIMPAMCAADLYGGWFYPFGRFALGGQLPWAAQLARDEARRAGDERAEEALAGIMREPERPLWHLPLSDAPEEVLRYAPFYSDWVGHPERDEYWEERDLTERLTGHSAPALHIGGWHDPFLAGTLRTFEALHAADPAGHDLVVGPWAHIPWARRTGGWDHGESAAGFVDEFQIAWLGQRLKYTSSVHETVKVLYFEMGSGRWETSGAWPPLSAAPDARTWFLKSGRGPANSAHGTGLLDPRRGYSRDDTASDEYVYDARLPMSLGSLAPLDRSTLQERNEILVYTGAPLDGALHLAGAPRLKVWCAVNGGPTDLVALLSIVSPSGNARFLTLGRQTVESEDYEPIELVLLDTAVEIPAGAAVRLELTGSAFPFLARHPNGAASPASVHRAGQGALRVAVVSVAHDERHPSCLVLPVRMYGEEG